MKIILVNDENKVLLLRKSQDNARHAGNSGLWNLPGGKINPGETITEALRREAYEEVGLKVIDHGTQPIFAGEWRPEVRGEKMQIIGLFYVCKQWTGEVTIDSEHDDFAWVGSNTFADFTILPPEDLAIEAYYSGQ